LVDLQPNTVADAQARFNTYIEQVVSDNPFLAFYETKYRNPSVQNIRDRMERGENVTPEDRRMVEAYDNAVAYINKYASDKQVAFNGQPIPEGVEDRYRSGEAALSTGTALRRAQEIGAQAAHTLDVIRSQVSSEIYQKIHRGLIENSIRISGEITAQDRTITVELIDKATGKHITDAPVQGVQNMSSRLGFTNISQVFEAFNPAQPGD